MAIHDQLAVSRLTQKWMLWALPWKMLLCVLRLKVSAASRRSSWGVDVVIVSVNPPPDNFMCFCNRSHRLIINDIILTKTIIRSHTNTRHGPASVVIDQSAPRIVNARMMQALNNLSPVPERKPSS